MKTEINKNFFRGFAAQFKKQMLVIKSRAPIAVIAPVILMFAAGIGGAFLPEFFPRDLSAIAAILVVAAIFVPLFSYKTISKERADGQHLALREYAHRRGIIIIGQLAADALLCLTYAAMGWFAHVFAATMLYGYIYGMFEILLRTFVLLSAALLICAVNICSYSYSKHRTVSYILIIILAAAFTGAAALFGTGLPLYAGRLFSGLLLSGAAVLIVLSYAGYLVRTRAER